MEQQVLLVDHSNVLKLGTVLGTVHPVKVVLLVINLMCCFNIPFFSFYQSCYLQVVGEKEPLFNGMFFCQVLHIMALKMWPLITVCSTRASILDPLLWLPPGGSLLCMVTTESSG